VPRKNIPKKKREPKNAHWLTFRGEKKALETWCRELSLPASTVRSRLAKGWTVDDALGTPPETKFRSTHQATQAPDPPPLKPYKGGARVRCTYKGQPFERHFGPWGSTKSKDEYARFCNDWRTRGPLAAMGLAVVMIGELVANYTEWAATEYRKRGRESSEMHCQRSALRVLVERFGGEDVSDFTPDKLREYQRACVEKKWAADTVKGYTNRVLQCFRFAVERGHYPGEMLDRLRAVRNVRRGESMGKRSKKRVPVPLEHVEAVMPHLDKRDAVRAMLETMIRAQLFVGCRPIEICVMRPVDLDRTKSEWMYTVPAAWHKLDHFGRDQIYWIGPRAQALLLPYLEGRGPEEPLFHLPTKTTAVKRVWYERKIGEACVKAGVPEWNPHRLRHTRATAVADASGTEDGSRVIGDSEEVARRHYIADENAKRRIARDSG
jgi:integrase